MPPIGRILNLRTAPTWRPVGRTPGRRRFCCQGR